MTKVKTILAVAGLSVLILAILFSAGCTDSADGGEKITIKGYVTNRELRRSPRRRQGGDIQGLV